MNIDDRPREKALKYGFEYLSNRELLAILLRSGVKNHSVLEVSKDILNLRKHIGYLQHVKLHELMAVRGISKIKALEIMACFELSRRISYELMKEEDVIQSPKGCIDWLNKKIGFSDQEHFIVLFLNTKGNVMDEQELFTGSEKECQVSPKLICRRAIEMGCDRLMLVHNHPSGQVIPSQQDYEFLEKMIEVSEIVGITIVDNLIVSHNQYYSFKEKMIIR